MNIANFGHIVTALREHELNMLINRMVFHLVHFAKDLTEISRIVTNQSSTYWAKNRTRKNKSPAFSSLDLAH